MAKKQTNMATDKANDLATQAKDQAGKVQTDRERDLATARGRQTQLFEGTMEGIKQQRETGGYDPSRLATLRGNNDEFTRTGGYDQAQLDRIRAGFDNTVGGYDPTQLQFLRDRGREFAETGGYDLDSAAKIRGGYGNFIDTGGFSDKDKSDFLNSATSGVGATSRILQQQAQEQRAKSGGMGSGGSPAQIARQLAQTQAQSGVDARTKMTQLVNEGKLSGLSGLSNFEGGVAGGRRSALEGLGSLEGDVAQGTRSANDSRARLESDVASGRRDAQGMSQQLEGGVASGVQDANALSAQMFNAQTGEVSDLGNKVLAALGLNFGTQEAAINALTQLSRNPGFFRTLTGGLKELGDFWSAVKP